MKRKGLVNRNDIVYLLVIAILAIIVFFQKCGSDKFVPPAPTMSTVVQYIKIHDTVLIKPKYIKSKKDTLWIDSLVYIPDTSYPRLLEQYKELGNKYFATNIFKTEVKLGKFGNGRMIDTVKANALIGSSFEYDILVPEKTVTIIRTSPPKRQIYVGAGAYGNRQNIVGGVYVGGLYKDRKDRISGVSVGYGNNQLQFGISSYWKIKF